MLLNKYFYHKVLNKLKYLFLRPKFYANSVVTKSITSSGIYAGVPCKYICSLDEYISKNSCFFKILRKWGILRRESIIKTLHLTKND